MSWKRIVPFSIGRPSVTLSIVMLCPGADFMFMRSAISTLPDTPSNTPADASVKPTLRISAVALAFMPSAFHEADPEMSARPVTPAGPRNSGERS